MVAFPPNTLVSSINGKSGLSYDSALKLQKGEEKCNASSS